MFDSKLYPHTHTDLSKLRALLSEAGRVRWSILGSTFSTAWTTHAVHIVTLLSNPFVGQFTAQRRVLSVLDLLILARLDIAHGWIVVLT